MVTSWLGLVNDNMPDAYNTQDYKIYSWIPYPIMHHTLNVTTDSNILEFVTLFIHYLLSLTIINDHVVTSQCPVWEWLSVAPPSCLPAEVHRDTLASHWAGQATVPHCPLRRRPGQPHPLLEWHWPAEFAAPPPLLHLHDIASLHWVEINIC